MAKRQPKKTVTPTQEPSTTEKQLLAVDGGSQQFIIQGQVSSTPYPNVHDIEKLEQIQPGMGRELMDVFRRFSDNQIELANQEMEREIENDKREQDRQDRIEERQLLTIYLLFWWGIAAIWGYVCLASFAVPIYQPIPMFGVPVALIGGGYAILKWAKRKNSVKETAQK